MTYRGVLVAWVAAGFVWTWATSASQALDLVVDGQSKAAIVVASAQPEKPAKARPRRSEGVGDAMAAQTLQDWIRKITDAELPIVASAPQDRPAIFVGKAAIDAGLKLDDLQSPSREGVRIVCDGRRVLLAGQNDTATVKAACRLLEELGCRYFMDSPLGEVYPRAKTLSVKDLDLREQPGFLYRKIWGSQWSGTRLWKIWNGDGGEAMDMRHAWGAYVDKKLFDEHPEYFALRGGQRKQGDWYCTSNPALREIFARGVIAAIERGERNPSVSPPDGTAYCECEACRKQDDPSAIEPSSGRVSITNRYVDFINDVARRVAAKHPESRLSYYCYADYTQAPTGGAKLAPNVVAWIAPIRYCRLHRIGNPVCPSRVQLDEMLAGWSKSASQIGYRTYNYNLAECVVPFSMLSVWKHDIPYLKKSGCVGVNLETLASWQLYGPHSYLSIRLAYDPDADADRLMADYFQRFLGTAAEPMREYWQAIDEAYDKTPAHAGSFFALHQVWTLELLMRCRRCLDLAADLAIGNRPVAARVAMFREGFDNALQYMAVREALHRGDLADAKSLCDRLAQRAEAQVKAGYGNHYTPAYFQRFLRNHVEAVAAAVGKGRVVAVLPDRWRLAYDEQNQGVSKEFFAAAFDDSGWKQVATYSDTLDGQGLEDRKTVLWYRTTIDLPKLSGKPSLVFMEVDGDATVYVNGREIGASPKKRTTFALDAADALREGKNAIAVRVDHSKITELFLGGIIRPVYVVDSGI